jgi:hypothetical protein
MERSVVKNLFFNSGTGFSPRGRLTVQPVKCIPNIIFNAWELKIMARMAMSHPDASPAVLPKESSGQHDKMCKIEKTLCAYVLMLLCSDVPMNIQVIPTKDYVRSFKQKMRNEPNAKVRIQNIEYRMQNQKMCISVCLTKDCAAIFPANCLSCFQVVISGYQETKPNEPNFEKWFKRI